MGIRRMRRMKAEGTGMSASWTGGSCQPSGMKTTSYTFAYRKTTNEKNEITEFVRLARRLLFSLHCFSFHFLSKSGSRCVIGGFERSTEHEVMIDRMRSFYVSYEFLGNWDLDWVVFI